LLRWLHDDAQKQLAEASKSPAREIVGDALEVVIGRTLADAGDVEWEMTQKTDRGSWFEMSGLLHNKTYGEHLPAVFCYPKQWNGTTTVWLANDGKAVLYNADGSLKPQAKKFVDAGGTVVGVDLFCQGEFLADGEPFTKTPRVKNTREAAAYTLGYNHAVFAQRVHDVLSTVKFIKTHERPSKQIQLAGFEEAAPVAAMAAALSGNSVDRVAIDLKGFRFGEVLDIRSPSFLPGGAKYADLPGVMKTSKASVDSLVRSGK
jgi:hypothetical protein